MAERSRYEQMDEKMAKFLFGDRSEKEETSEEEPKEEDEEDESHTEKKQLEAQALDLDSLFSKLNSKEMMGTIDSLMNSASHLKPMMTKLEPFIQRFLKK